METTMLRTTTTPEEQSKPVYEPPRIQEMTEREILNTFQITQSMAGWWTLPTCC